MTLKAPVRSVYSLTATLALAAMIVGCSGGSDGDSSNSPDLGNGGQKTEAGTDADTSEISSKRFSVPKGGLSFADADVEDRDVSPDEKNHQTIRTFSLYYRNGARVTKSSIPANSSFCQLSVDGSPDDSPSDVVFQASNLHNGQISYGHRTTNGENRYWFSLYLQAEMFHGFSLTCLNTPNSTAIKNHIGSALMISNPANEPKAAQRTEINPLKFGIQFVTKENSLGQGPLVANTFSIRAQDLPIQDVNEIRLSIVKALPGETPEKIGIDQVIYRGQGTVVGSLALTFSLKGEDAVRVTNQMRLLSYELIVNGRDTMVIKLSDLCTNSPESIVDLSGRNGCPKFKPSSVIGRTLSDINSVCSKDQLEYGKISDVATAHKHSKFKAKDSCDRAIVTLLDEGLIWIQIGEGASFARLTANSRDNCENYHRDAFYLRQDEELQTKVNPNVKITPIPGNDLYEVCLSNI